MLNSFIHSFILSLFIALGLFRLPRRVFGIIQFQIVRFFGRFVADFVQFDLVGFNVGCGIVAMDKELFNPSSIVVGQFVGFFPKSFGKNPTN